MAYEAIDKHAKSDRKNKVALYYQDGSRKEKYTFKEMKDFSNKAGNVLKNYGDVEKGDRVFILCHVLRVIFRTFRCSEIRRNCWTAI